jgi:hypothetical protein
LSGVSAHQLRGMVEEAYQNHMSSAGDASGLVSAGNITQGLDIYAQKGQWDELFDVCDKSAPEQGPRYVRYLLLCMLLIHVVGSTC